MSLLTAAPRSSTYTLSLPDALPICCRSLDELKAADWLGAFRGRLTPDQLRAVEREAPERIDLPSNWSGVSRPRKDRKSTRLNSSHLGISYAVFRLKKTKKMLQALRH